MRGRRPKLTAEEQPFAPGTSCQKTSMCSSKHIKNTAIASRKFLCFPAKYGLFHDDYHGLYTPAANSQQKNANPQ
jgi:hypothetical protein